MNDVTKNQYNNIIKKIKTSTNLSTKDIKKVLVSLYASLLDELLRNDNKLSVPHLGTCFFYDVKLNSVTLESLNIDVTLCKNSKSYIEGIVRVVEGDIDDCKSVPQTV